MKWSKLGSVALFILGLIPYIAIGYLVVTTWNDYIFEPELFTKSIWTFWRFSTGYYIRYILEWLALLGSWAFWYLFCKAFKYLVWYRG